MNDQQCHSCYESSAAMATTCIYCGARLEPRRADMLVAAVSAVTQEFKFSIGPAADSMASCYATFTDDAEGLRECLADCNAQTAIAEFAERLHRQLAKTCVDVLWAQGNIDAVPELRKKIIEQFFADIAELK